MLDVSAAYTAAIKDKNRTDRITGTIKLCDGETINITDDIIVNNSVTLKEQLVSGDTFEIGTFYTNQLDITVYDNNFLSRTYANARITPKYEIQLADGTWESVPLGIFTVDNSLTKRKGSIHKLTAFDDSTKFDVDISAYSGGKKTVQQHIKDLAADVGITLVTTDFSSYPNYDLTVDSTVSSSVQTYRDLIEWCCALMASSARINRYGKLEIVKLKEKKKIVDGALVYDADYTVEGYERTGTEFFDLRALTKYFSTAFDGEPYVYKNHAVLTLPDAAARNATMFIPENPLLQSVSDAERKTAFETCVNTIYIALRRVEFSFNGNPAIECFDTLFGNGGKIDINGTIAFFPTLLVWKYRGAHKVSCAFAELTDEATESASEAAISVVNASTINKMPVQVKSKTEKRLDGVGKTAFDASSVGKFTATGIGCEIFNDYENNIASSLYAHAEGNGTKATAPSTHAEGNSTTASSTYAHAEGRETTASGESSHAEGNNTTASGYCSHAEGYNATASGGYSHAEGYNAVASGWYSHAGGINSEAKAEASFAHGMYAVSNYRGGAAFGIMNKTKDALFVVGNGWANTKTESDALVLDNAGNLWVAGSIKCGGGSGGYTLSPATADTLGGVMIGENINVSDSGTISVDLSAYLKSDAISDWAKADSKPTYTAEEIGAVTPYELDSKDYLKATEITGQVIDLNDVMLNTASDKGKSRRYFCTSASAQNISNRPVSVNEPFELTVDNIRYVNADAFNSVQRYTSATRKRSYTRWCDDNVWRAWMCDTDIVIYGTVTSELPKSFDYATYGEGYNQVEIEPYYDNNASPIRNRIVLTLTSATFYDRDVLTVGDSVEHLKIENGTVTMSLTGTKTLSFMIKYTNKRA